MHYHSDLYVMVFKRMRSKPERFSNRGTRFGAEDKSVDISKGNLLALNVSGKPSVRKK
jgi:hypothetical protein